MGNLARGVALKTQNPAKLCLITSFFADTGTGLKRYRTMAADLAITCSADGPERAPAANKLPRKHRGQRHGRSAVWERRAHKSWMAEFRAALAQGFEPLLCVRTDPKLAPQIDLVPGSPPPTKRRDLQYATVPGGRQILAPCSVDLVPATTMCASPRARALRSLAALALGAHDLGELSRRHGGARVLHAWEKRAGGWREPPLAARRKRLRLTEGSEQKYGLRTRGGKGSHHWGKKQAALL